MISNSSSPKWPVHGRTVNIFTLALVPLSFYVVLIMSMVMNTAGDRDIYHHIFSLPFGYNRIEPGFKFYAQAWKSLGVPPGVSIVSTCGIIYVLLGRFWFNYCRLSWLESLLLFNFFSFSIFQYYLGTSIRMGLATSLALYAFMKLADGKKRYLPLLFLAPLIHYGTIPFVLISAWIYATRSISWRIHFIFIILASILSSIAVYEILHSFAFGAYYMSYFNSDFGDTDRIFPFTGLFYWFALFLIVQIIDDSFLKRAAFYGIPLLVYGSLGQPGAPIFFKMLIPCMFIAAVLLSDVYRKVAKNNMTLDIRVILLLFFNVLALLYALHQYHYI